MEGPRKEKGTDVTGSQLYRYYRWYLTDEELKLYAQYFEEELPAAFRLNLHNKSDAYAHAINALLSKYLQDRIGADTAVKKLPDVPYAYSFTASRSQLKSRPELNKVHKFLVLCNECGLLTRQEFVSMLPPAFLGAQRGEVVLDMCAAPGSKTLQLLEQVGVTGLVMANDAELSRCHVLLHGVAAQPTPQLVLTNLDATRYPSVTTFDRVLADVPCSGDGTVRKARDLLSGWRLEHSLSLHGVQLRVLIRGLQLLREGGTLCYSTCSLNVVENEAVVHAAIAALGGAVELIDCSKMLPGVARAPGLTTWAVVAPSLDYTYSSYEELAADVKLSERARVRYVPTMFATGDTSQLYRCMRFYPWLNDSGGFFVALLRKTSALPPGPLTTQIELQAASYTAQNAKTAYNCNRSRRIPLHPQRRMRDQAAIAGIRTAFAFRCFFEPGDADEVYNNFSQRDLPDVQASRIYVLNKYAASILYSQPEAFEMLHIVQAGCPAFARHSGLHGGAAYRVEGPVACILRNTDLVCSISYACFVAILQKSLAGEDADESITFQQLIATDPVLQADCDYMRSLPAQSLMLLWVKLDGLGPDELQRATFVNELMVNCWVGGASVGLHLKKKARHAVQCLIANEDIEEIVVTGRSIRRAEYRARRSRQAKGKQEKEPIEERAHSEGGE